VAFILDRFRHEHSNYLVANLNPELRDVKDLSHLKKLVSDLTRIWNIKVNGADAATELKPLVP